MTFCFLVGAGHDHKYERTCPVFKSTCVNYNKDGSAKAPVHLTIGNAGYGDFLSEFALHNAALLPC